MDSKNMDKSIVCGFFGPPCIDDSVIQLYPIILFFTAFDTSRATDAPYLLA